MKAVRPLLSARLRCALLGFAAATPLAFASGAASSAEPPTLVELVEVADLNALAASPDGRRVAFRSDRASVEGNDYRLAWHVVELATGERRQIADAGQAIVNDPGLADAEPPVWSPDGRWIHYRALVSGSVQIWRAAVDGSGAAAVTDEDGDVLSLHLSEDGASLDYEVGPSRREIEQAELAEYESGILVDGRVELAQNLFRGGIINGRRATQRFAGPWFSRGGILWARPPRSLRLDLATLALTDLSPDEAAASPGGTSEVEVTEVRSSHGDIASASWRGDHGELRVTRRDSTSFSCPDEHCRGERIAWLAWRPGRDELVFATVNRSFVQTLRRWDLASGQVRVIARGDGLLSGGRDSRRPCVVLAAEAVCVHAGPNAPPRLEAIPFETGEERSLFDPNAALRARRWPVVERLEWRDSEGRLFTGLLFLPEARPAQPLPLFVNYYRCEGFVRGGVGDEWPFALLAANGIAAACINATRMTGRQDGVGQYRAALAGVARLIDSLAGRGLVDRRRVGMGGLSFGSEVTLWTLIHSDLLAAASIASPQLEASVYWFNGVRGREHHGILREVWGLGAPEESPERWQLLSAARNTGRIRAPLLLQLAEQESRYAIELYARLSQSPTPTELYAFPDELHIKVQPRHRLAVYRRNLDWFRFWLLGREDPDPSKAQQYRRWRDLAQRSTSADQDRQPRSQSSSETRSNSR